ncbi:DUF7167 family protein [Faecalimicrobium sp. JNUCC 81]
MKIELSASLLGFSVGGYNYTTEIEISDEDTKGMTEEQKEKYIEKQVYDYLMDTLDWGYEIKD